MFIVDILISLLGDKGIIGLIGLVIFLFTFRYSKFVFGLIEKQTIGNREFIKEKLEKLFLEISEEKITYFLFGITFGLGAVVFSLLTLVGHINWGIFLGLSFVVLGWKIPKPLMNYLVEKRIREYEKQMVDALQLLSNGIRAGLSVPQAIGMVVDELPPPVSQEFNLILQQNKIGIPLDECLLNLAKRVPTEDNEMFVSAVNILRETGGNLAEVFDTIVAVIRERVRLKQKIDTITSRGKIQGLTIFCIPFAMGLIYTINDPEVMGKVFTKPAGILLILVAAALNLLGGFIILKIVKIKV